jgi:phenylalanyl-tRNA synthetase beta subunit
VEESEVAALVLGAAGPYLLRMDRFDTFEKDGRTSYAFRLVFEAPDKTLADTDLDQAMEAVSAALVSSGFEVR